MNWSFFHKLGSLKWFYRISQRWLFVLSTITCLLLLIGLSWGLLFAPADYLQGNSYRIIYVHVPSAFLAEALYAMMAMCAVVSLVWRIKIADVALQSMASVGSSFCFLALITGSIWGKPTWGTWWVWDARLTSMLLLLFLYVGVIALKSGIQNVQSSSKACAILTLVGVVNLPIIKYSVDWWNTLHQGSTLKFTKSSIDPSMLWPLLISIAGFYCFSLLVIILRMRVEILIRDKRKSWVQEYVLQTRN